MRPIAAALNRQIASRAQARALCARLDGRLVVLRVRDTALSAAFLLKDSGISMSAAVDGEPDVIITGSLLALMRLAATGDEELMRSGVIDLAGDGETAASFRQLLRYARPDPEEELSRLVGDVAAHGIGEVIRGIGNWGRQSGAVIRQNIGEYLQEESRLLPGRRDIHRFREAVETLRDDVERLEARIRHLQQRDADGGGP